MARRKEAARALASPKKKSKKRKRSGGVSLKEKLKKVTTLRGKLARDYEWLQLKEEREPVPPPLPPSQVNNLGVRGVST